MKSVEQTELASLEMTAEKRWCFILRVKEHTADISGAIKRGKSTNFSEIFPRGNVLGTHSTFSHIQKLNIL